MRILSFSGLGEDFCGGEFSGLFRGGLGRFGLGLEDFFADGEEGADFDLAVFQDGAGAHGRAAVAGDGGGKGAFGDGADAGGGVVDGGGDGGVFGVGAFHRQQPLADRRDEKVGGQDFANVRFQSDAAQPGDGEDEGVAFAGVELGDSGLEVSADRPGLEFWKSPAQQRGSARAGGSDDRAVGELAEGEIFARDDGVAGVLGESDGGEDEGVGGGGGGGGGSHVLEGVDGEVGAVGEELGLEVFDEKFFSADVGEGLVGDVIAAGGDADDDGSDAGAGAREGPGDRLGLRQCERAFAGGDAEHWKSAIMPQGGFFFRFWEMRGSRGWIDSPFVIQSARPRFFFSRR